ncbi:MAG: hypothetical protein GSR84_01735 [Desulfurococcales archaeon]|nr:hypothetical protein [Desulfurococcales archaeon]
MLVVAILASALLSAYLGLVNPVVGPAGWLLLGGDERVIESGLASVTVRLSVYRVNVDGDSLVRAVDSIVDYCREDAAGYLGACGVKPGELEQYAVEGRLAVIAVVARVSNTGLVPVRVGGPGPICGYSYNLEHLRDPRLDPLVAHREPVSELEYRVLEGGVAVGYGGLCQLALIMHMLPPGGSSATIYGFIVVTPFRGVFSMTSSVEVDGVWHDVSLNVTVEAR